MLSSMTMFPLIQGVLAFDTPYNGLARSMFVYGAFSRYDKVSGVFNVMTALSAAAPAAIGRMGIKRGAASAMKASRFASPAWKSWQLIAVRTGTVGAIAAGGVAAYTHRKEIMQGVRTLRNVKKEDIVQGYHTSIDRLGQGLAYINRGNVGQSFAWLSDHFAFVGALMKQKELNRRLERMAALKGVGIHDYYVSLGENGYWSGGYFVPERTFCAVPDQKYAAHRLFERHVVPDVDDEIQAHVSLFKTDKNVAYEQMTQDAAKRVVQWFSDEADLFDDPRFAAPMPAEEDDKDIDQDIANAEQEAGEEEGVDPDALPDESPVDVAAAASLVALPEDTEDALSEDAPKADDKQTYMRNLFRIAQQTGTDIRAWSSRLPAMGMATMPPLPTLPAMPTMSSVTLPNVSLPGAGLFSKKQDTSVEQPSKGDEKGDKSGDSAAQVDVSASEKPPVERG
jgi:hypothetical protein